MRKRSELLTVVTVWVVTKAKSSWVYQAERMASKEKRSQEPKWGPT